MTKNVLKVARCVAANYSSSEDSIARRRRYHELLDFHNTLTPRFANLPSRIALNNGFWPSLIHLYYL